MPLIIIADFGFWISDLKSEFVNPQSQILYPPIYFYVSPVFIDETL
jgi:hypothetical protein